MEAHLPVDHEAVSEAGEQQVARFALEGSRQHGVVLELWIPRHQAGLVRTILAEFLDKA